MTKYVAVVNPVGGSGKTTTAHALAVAFAEYGKRTLLVDCSSTATLTFLLGIENPRTTTFDIFDDSSFAESAIVSTGERFYFLPADSRLNFLDQRVKSLSDLTGNFKKSMDLLDSPFDYIILDTPSTLSYTWMATLFLADFHIGVAHSSLSSARGILQTQEVLGALAKDRKTKSFWLGTVSTQGGESLDLLSDETHVLAPAIPKSGSVVAAESSGKSVLNTDNTGKVALAYRELAYFLLEDIATKN